MHCISHAHAHSSSCRCSSKAQQLKKSQHAAQPTEPHTHVAPRAQPRSHVVCVHHGVTERPVAQQRDAQRAVHLLHCHLVPCRVVDGAPVFLRGTTARSQPSSLDGPRMIHIFEFCHAVCCTDHSKARRCGRLQQHRQPVTEQAGAIPPGHETTAKAPWLLQSDLSFSNLTCIHQPQTHRLKNCQAAESSHKDAGPTREVKGMRP